jgi:hypothetical protein
LENDPPVIHGCLENDFKPAILMAAERAEVFVDTVVITVRKR